MTRPSCQSWSVIVHCSSPQDDATIKCWGYNGEGQLGQGHTSNRGANANGPCPPSSITASLNLAIRFLTLVPGLSIAELGSNLASIDLGAGKTAVAVSAGNRHVCALLVRLPIERLGGVNP